MRQNLRSLSEQDRALLSAALLTYKASLVAQEALDEDQMQQIRELLRFLQPMESVVPVTIDPTRAEEEGIILIRKIRSVLRSFDTILVDYCRKHGLDPEDWQVTRDIKRTHNGLYLEAICKSKSHTAKAERSQASHKKNQHDLLKEKYSKMSVAEILASLGLSGK